MRGEIKKISILPIQKNKLFNKIAVFINIGILIFLGIFLGIDDTLAANCDPNNTPPAPVLADNLAPGVQLFKDGGCFTTYGTTDFARCVTISEKGYKIHFWNFSAGDSPSDVKTTPTSDSEYNLAARSDLNFLWEGGGNLIYKNVKDPTTYYAVEKTSNGDIGQIDAINTTGIFHAGRTKVWDSFMSQNKTWDVFNIDNSCSRKLPYLESGVNADGSRFLWRIVISGKIKFDDKIISSRGNVSARLGSKDGPTLDTVPTDSEGNFEFSRAYGAGLGVGNEELWINQNTEHIITLSFTYEDEAGNKYQDFKDLAFPSDFKNHATQNDTKVADPSIAFNLTEDKKVTSFDRNESATANTIIDNLIGTNECGNATSIGDAILVGMCNITVMIREWALGLMCFAQDKLVESLTGSPMNSTKGCGSNTVLKKYQNDPNMKIFNESKTPAPTVPTVPLPTIPTGGVSGGAH